MFNNSLNKVSSEVKKLTFYRPFAKKPSCSSTVDIKDFNSQPFFIIFLFNEIRKAYIKTEGNTSPEIGKPQPQTDSDSTAEKRVSNLSEYFNPRLTGAQKSYYLAKITRTVKLVINFPWAKSNGDEQEYSILKPKINKLFNLKNITKGELVKVFQELKILFKKGNAKKTQISIDIKINKKGQDNKKLYSKFPGAAHATLIIDSLNSVIEIFEGKVNRLPKKKREDSVFAKFLEILKFRKEEIANIISKKISREFVYSRHIKIVSLSFLLTLIINEIQKSVFFEKELSWNSFKVPKGAHKVTNAFMKGFMAHFLEQGKNSFTIIRSSSKRRIKNSYVYTTIYKIQWSGTTKAFDRIINKFRYTELKNIPRVIPIPDWEADPSGFGVKLKVLFNKTVKTFHIPQISGADVQAKFKPSSRFISIINSYQNQAIFVSKPVLDILLKNGHLFSGSYFSNERKPIFGTYLPLIDYVLLFVEYCYKEGKYLTQERLLLFCTSFTEFRSDFLQRKKEALWLSFYAKSNFPLYFRYGFDFRGRDVIASLLDPIKYRFSRACLTFNHSSETVLSTRGITHYTVFVFNLFSIQNSPGKFKCYSSIILYVFKGVTPGLPGLVTFVKTTVQQAPFIIMTQKKCLYYIPTFCNVGLIPFIEIHLDAPASAFQILVTFSNNFEKASILNLVNHESGECQDPYSIWAIPTEEDLKKTPCLKGLTREMKKKFFILSLLGSSIEIICEEFYKHFGLEYEDAKDIWLFLARFYHGYFKKELKFISHLYNKSKNSDGSVAINLPLYNFEFKYYAKEKSEQFKLKVKKGKSSVSIQPAYWYFSDKPNNNRKATAFRANLIHALDAHVKHYVVEEFRGKGYHIHATHDCFKVHPNHADFAIAAYNRAIVNISEIFIEDLKDCKGFTCFTEEQKQQILNANYSINAF